MCTCDTFVSDLARIGLGTRDPFLRGREAAPGLARIDLGTRDPFLWGKEVAPELESVFKIAVIAWWGLNCTLECHYGERKLACKLN